MPVTDAGVSLLDKVEATVHAGHSLSEQELESALKHFATPELEERLALANTSRKWLAQVWSP